ncbi:MAG: metal ABC transporter permease [Candidatus Sumerlaeaceae bacterium]|nr:metal ABC transporter permease [Candidatus Sumerlaeaceae bacterium]
MILWDKVAELAGNHTLQTVAMGSAALGIVSGVLGAFAVLRKQSLLGDAMSHAALPGIALIFLLTGSKAPLMLVLGAALSGWLGILLIMLIVNTTRIKSDSALGIIMSVFFGTGLVLLTFIQKRPDASQAGLDRFLFGQAAALLRSDVVTIAALGGVALAMVSILWKEFKLLSFDRDFGATLGYPMAFLDVLLTSFVVLAVVLGLQTVGVVLMSALIVAPAAAARQWTDRLGTMVLLSGLIGAVSGTTGAVISSAADRLPTGPMVVLMASLIVAVSLLMAPRRGLVWAWLRHRANNQRLCLETVLEDLCELAQQHTDPGHGHSEKMLKAISPGAGDIGRSLRELEERGWVKQTSPGHWAITEAGLREIPEIQTRYFGRDREATA